MLRKSLFWFLFALLAVTDAARAEDGFSREFPVLTAAGQTDWQVVKLGNGFASLHSVEVNPTSTPATCSLQFQGSLKRNPTVPNNVGSAIDCTSPSITFFVDKPLFSVRGDLTALTGTGNTDITDCALDSGVAEVTATADHGLTTGDRVTITGIVGAVECNVVNNPITVTAAKTFKLDGVTAVTAYVSGGAYVSVPTLTVRYIGVQ